MSLSVIDFLGLSLSFWLSRFDSVKTTSLSELNEFEVAGPVLGAVLCVDAKSIQRYAAEGVAVRVGHGRYLLLQSVQNLVRRLREQAAGRIGRDQNCDAVKANAELKQAQKRLTELRIAQLEGNLISLDEVKTAWDEVALSVRQLFMSLPSRARFDLPHLSGADQKVLERLTREMLTEVATEGAVRLPTNPQRSHRQLHFSFDTQP
jgi:phage terminase Nu1 subunit (DNA packaging protein)